MGLFKKASAYMGHVDKKLIKSGALARGTVTSCERTAMSTGNQVQSVVCKLTVQVELDGFPPYTAECMHPIQIPYLPQFESGAGVVAVRVDPDDHSNIVLSLQENPPAPAPADGEIAARTLTESEIGDLGTIGITVDAANQTGLPMHKGKLTGDEILATGTRCRAVVLSATPLNMTKEGVGEVYGLVLSVLADGAAPVHAQVGIGVPAACVPLLFEGANLPARTRADVQDATAIDWDAAVAEARTGPRPA